MIEKPTHRLQTTPRMRAQDLAEYMAASDVAKRSVLRRCKFRSIAAMLNHREAKASIARWLKDGSGDLSWLNAEAERIRKKLADSDFDAEVNEHNAGYIEAFRDVCKTLAIPPCDMASPKGKMQIGMGGLTVTYSPDLLLTRINKSNVAKAGALFLLYQKGKAASEEPSAYLNSLSFSYLSGAPVVDNAETDKKLCLTVCAHSGQVRDAPGNAVTRFKNMQAAGTTIAEQWASIPPTANMILT